MTVKRPILRYHGGKWKLAPWIIGHFPKHRGYNEPMGGGGSVLLQKPRSYAEVYNDIWGVVVNVFKVLRSPSDGKELQRLLELTPYSRTEFEESGKLTDDPVENARRTILGSFLGYSSASTDPEYTTGFRAKSNKSGTPPARDWANYPKHITSFIERLKGVVIENKDYREILTQQDAPDTLHFLDPPYVHATRQLGPKKNVYRHEFTDQDHIDMAAAVRQLKGTVIICGYDSDLYADIFKGWHTSRRKALADGARERVEVLWSNRPFPNQLFQH